MSLNRPESEAAAAHLNYEVKAMAEISGWHQRLLREPELAVLKNATLEAALIHMRLLIEFVAGRPASGGGSAQRLEEAGHSAGSFRERLARVARRPARYLP